MFYTDVHDPLELSCAHGGAVVEPCVCLWHPVVQLKHHLLDSSSFLHGIVRTVSPNPFGNAYVTLLRASFFCSIDLRVSVPRPKPHRLDHFSFVAGLSE